MRVSVVFLPIGVLTLLRVCINFGSAALFIIDMLCMVVSVVLWGCVSHS